MNDIMGSECNSGCESGWTLYLEQSFLSPFPSPRGIEENRGKYEEEEDEEEEDLSMVSDASSGPPHFHEDEDYCDYNNGYFYHPPIDATLPPTKQSGKKQSSKEKRHRKVQEQISFLDDTASSPLFNMANTNLALANNQASMENKLDFSQGHSATHFEGKSAYQGHFGFFQSPVSGNQLQDQFGYFQSPVSGNQLQHNQWFDGKRIGMR